jgi:hypothetical protein
MPQNTYWRTSRDAPPAGDIELIVGVQDAALHIILDCPPAIGMGDPPPRVGVTTDQGDSLQSQTAIAFGIGRVGGRHLHIAVFDPPPSECQVLNVVVTIGDVAVLTVRALKVYTSSGP